MDKPVDRKLCRRFNEPGHAHALTFSCFQQRPSLSKDRSRQWFIDALSQARDKFAFHLWAYVIMPEHVHVLLMPTQEGYSINCILLSIKQPVARRSVNWVRRIAPGFLKSMEDRQPNGSVHYRFWQRGGGYDRNVTTDETVWSELQYIHANPVRRGLCSHLADWPWSSALEYENPDSGLLPIDRESLPTRVIS